MQVSARGEGGLKEDLMSGCPAAFPLGGGRWLWVCLIVADSICLVAVSLALGGAELGDMIQFSRPEFDFLLWLMFVFLFVWLISFVCVGEVGPTASPLFVSPGSCLMCTRASCRIAD